MSHEKHSDEEKEKWWKLRNSNPPILPKYIAIRFGVKASSVRAYIRDRALKEGVHLPGDLGLRTINEKLRGRWNGK